MPTYQHYFARFYCDTSLNNLSLNDGVDDFAVALATGYYYLDDPNGGDDFLAHLQAQIRASDATFASAEVTLAAATGLITINFATGGTNIAITWTDSALQTLLGFSGTQSGAESYTATNQPRYFWRPSKAATAYNDLDEFWVPKSTCKNTRAMDGTTGHVPGPTLYYTEMAYSHLPKADVLTTSSTINESFQKFYIDMCEADAGGRLLVQTDRTQAGGAYFHEALFAAEEMGSFDDYSKRNRDDYNGFWSIKLPLWRKV